MGESYPKPGSKKYCTIKIVVKNDGKTWSLELPDMSEIRLQNKKDTDLV